MIHIAGPLVCDQQLCTRCGLVLSDYRNAMWPIGQPAPAGWAEGAHVEVIDGNPRQFLVTDDAADCGLRA